MTFYPSTLIMTMYIYCGGCSLFGVHCSKMALVFFGMGPLFPKFLLLFKQTKHPFHYNMKYYVAKSRKRSDHRYELTMENSVSKQSFLLLVLKVVIAAAAVPLSLMTLCSICNEKRNKKSYKLRQIEGHIST